MSKNYTNSFLALKAQLNRLDRVKICDVITHKFLLIITLLFFSVNSKAQTNEQIGVMMAECSGWYLSAYIILLKVPGNSDAATVKKDLGLMTGDFAKKLIGGSRADQIGSIPMRQTNQSVKDGTINQWINTVAQKTQSCETYLKKYQPQIGKALGY